MHSCLMIDEALVNIVKDVEGSTLLNIALTCRTFYEPAMDQVWYELGGFKPLIRCLPKNITYVNTSCPYRNHLSVVR